MSDPAQVHNETVRRVVAELWAASGQSPSKLNVMAESLLVGIGMFNFPSDPRRQALIIQEIADGAADRARAVR